MSVPMDVESLSGHSSCFASDTSLICGSSPSPPATLSGESHSAAASTPSPVCAGPSQSTGESLSLGSLSRETDISATSSPSELAVVCGSSSSYFRLDSDSIDGRSVVPMVDACLGDATSLILEDDDSHNDLENTIRGIRVDNAGDCHISDASRSTELYQDPDEGSSVPLLENTDGSYLDDNSLLEVFSDTPLRRKNTTAWSIDNASLCPVQDLRVVVPTCWQEEGEKQGTAGERNCRDPAGQDPVLSLQLEPEPHLNVDTADASISSPEQQTPTQQLPQDQADGGLERNVEEMQVDIRHLQMVKTQQQDGAQKRQKNGVCTFLRRLCKKLRGLGKRSAKVGPQNTTETYGIVQGTTETPVEEPEKSRSTEQKPSKRKGLRRFCFNVSCFK
ncbi:uncharacterized protein LOC134437570 [Engraulis encrasicolus]|uniref:uncharacterized protein LOC134437570 n=1 Tax=Engraulis encrasicolus TaxID=184585 RepID=UPI002FD73157